MAKITKKELLQIIQEEYSNVLKKKELTEKLNAINEEIAKIEETSIEEVHAGAEMHGGDHEGQHKAEFEKKGSHLVEEDTVEEGLEKNIHLSGSDVKFLDQKIGKFDGDKLELDPAYAKYFNPEVVGATLKAHSAEQKALEAGSEVAPMQEEAEVTQECGEPEGDGFEDVVVGAEEISESKEELNENKTFVFERGKKKTVEDRKKNISESLNRMLKLSGLGNNNTEE